MAEVPFEDFVTEIDTDEYGIDTLNFGKTEGGLYVPIKVSDGGAQVMEQLGSDTFGVGDTDVITAGTAVQLPTNACKKVTISAKDDNSGKVFVGDSTVSSNIFGAFLRSGDSVTINVSNTDMIYLDAENSGEGVRYYYV